MKFPIGGRLGMLIFLRGFAATWLSIAFIFRMAKKRKRKQRGAPPGTLEFTGERKVENPLVLRVQFNESNLETRHLAKDELPGVTEGSIVWYDIRGLHNIPLIEQFGKQFNMHSLVLEDILNTQQRPKYEEYGDHVFMIVSELTFNPATLELTDEQIAIYFGKNFVLTFQE
ncbi:MAG: CorA family divalent cation transporter, partial [Bacteroidota bacterium]